MMEGERPRSSRVRKPPARYDDHDVESSPPPPPAPLPSSSSAAAAPTVGRAPSKTKSPSVPPPTPMSDVNIAPPVAGVTEEPMPIDATPLPEPTLAAPPPLPISSAPPVPTEEAAPAPAPPQSTSQAEPEYTPWKHDGSLSPGSDLTELSDSTEASPARNGQLSPELSPLPLPSSPSKASKKVVMKGEPAETGALSLNITLGSSKGKAKELELEEKTESFKRKRSPTLEATDSSPPTLAPAPVPISAKLAEKKKPTAKENKRKQNDERSAKPVQKRKKRVIQESSEDEDSDEGEESEEGTEATSKTYRAQTKGDGKGKEVKRAQTGKRKVEEQVVSAKTAMASSGVSLKVKLPTEVPNGSATNATTTEPPRKKSKLNSEDPSPVQGSTPIPTTSAGSSKSNRKADLVKGKTPLSAAMSESGSTNSLSSSNAVSKSTVEQGSKFKSTTDTPTGKAKQTLLAKPKPRTSLPGNITSAGVASGSSTPVASTSTSTSVAPSSAPVNKTQAPVQKPRPAFLKGLLGKVAKKDDKEEKEKERLREKEEKEKEERAKKAAAETKPVMTPEEKAAWIKKEKEAMRATFAREKANAFDLLEQQTIMNDFETELRAEVNRMQAEHIQKYGNKVPPLPRLFTYGSMFSLWPRKDAPSGEKASERK